MSINARAFEAHDHSGCSKAALEAAAAHAEKNGLRLTPVRRRTLEILLEEHKALGAYDVLERLSEGGFGAQPPVAYRALEFLVENGFAHRIEKLNAFTACTHSIGDHEPVFFICDICRLVAEVPQSKVQGAIEGAADEIGFQPSSVHVEVMGHCPACAG